MHLLLALASLALPLPVQGTPPAATGGETDRGTLQRAVDRSWRETNDAMRVGDWTTALGPGRRMLELELELVGADHWDVAGSHHTLAMILEHLGADDEAREHLERVHAIALLHTGHPLYAIDAENYLADFEIRVTADGEARAELYRTELLQPEIRRHFDRGRYADALPLLHEQLEARQAVYGDEHHLCAKVLHELGLVHSLRRELDESEHYYRRALAVREVTLGPEHTLTGESLSNLGLVWTLTGRPLDAVQLFERSLPITLRERGRKSEQYVTVLDNCLACYRQLSEIVRAEEVAQEMLAVLIERYGRQSHRIVPGLNNLSMVYVDAGRFEEAEELLQEALSLLRARRRPPQQQQIQILANLGAVYGELGDYARAEPLAREALAISTKGRGERDPGTAQVLNNLAKLEMDLGDTGRGVAILRDVREIAAETLGETSELYLSATVNLAMLLARQGHLDEALPLARVAVTGLREHYGPNNARHAAALAGLAELHFALDDAEAGFALGDEALAIARAQPGGLHPRFIAILDGTGARHLARGAHDEAEVFLTEALRAAENQLGAAHPQLGQVLCDLAVLEHRRGEHARAAAYHRRALDLFRDHLELTASVQSERRQLALSATLRGVLDSYVSFAARSGISDAELYASVLAWKGSIFARQRRRRTQHDDPDLARARAELDAVTNRFASLALTPPSPELEAPWRARLAELGRAREELETRLAKQAAERRALGRDPRFASLRPDELARDLPDGAVLVDFLVYADHVVDPLGHGAGTPSLTAFVVRRDATPRRIDLGPIAPIADALATWRSAIAGASTGASATDEAARALRARVWEPFADDVATADLVLVSPDGVLGRLPFAALPGAEDGSFLIEDVALSVVAAPHLLPSALARPSGAGAASLLVVGGVDFDRYDEEPDEDTVAALEASATGTWRSVAHADGWSDPRPLAALPETAHESRLVVEVFANAFDDTVPDRLAGGRATETAFRAAAPDNAYVHLATHGFFVHTTAPAAEQRARWTTSPTLHPGLLSGIAFAGANTRRGEANDDGLLTAVEMATLDLDGVELLTLSACETGLGVEAAGEGLLGLQRAARTAGARSVLASLWKVDDAAAREWMSEFYTQLWEHGRTRSEAARRAQLASIAKRRPVRDWGAWVLSGDWR